MEANAPTPPGWSFSHYFYGAPDSPMLAPRGLSFEGRHLIVSDTGQNRVLIWRGLPETTHAEPALVLGQPDGRSTERNAGRAPDPRTLHYPSGVWSDGRKLAVADAWNHRILLWERFPLEHFAPADAVLGQADFWSVAVNRHGPGSGPTPQSLHWPYGIWGQDGALWVADTGNRRVLRFDRWPEDNGASADAVLGQADGYQAEYDPHYPIWPYSVKLSPQGALLITDTQYYRVFYWPHWQAAFAGAAPCLLGQPDRHSNGMNRYDLFPRADGLNWVYDAAFGPGGDLWVADTGNSRILQYAAPPQASGAPADALLGQPDFGTGSENAATVHSTETRLYWPFALAFHGPYLVAADTGNHRLAVYQKHSQSLRS
jgi:hypothetical protein